MSFRIMGPCWKDNVSVGLNHIELLRLTSFFYENKWKDVRQKAAQVAVLWFFFMMSGACAN